VRLTLAFAVVMAIVLSAIGWAVYGLFRADLNRGIDRALRVRSNEVAALVVENNDALAQSLRGLGGSEDDFAQVLASDGTPLASTPKVRHRALLGAPELRRVGRGGLVLEHPPVGGLHGSLRIRAEPVHSFGRGVVLVVGTTLVERQDSLRTLALLLALGGLVALLLASLAGYAVATAALRPVEAMRTRARAIAPGDSVQRLPVPPSGDEIARLGATLNDMLDRLQAAFARERAFAAEASHELRTPLAILRAEVELALSPGRSPAQLREALASVAEETERLIGLAEDLLVVARLEGGHLPIHATDVDASEVLKASAVRFGSRARRLGRSLRVEQAVEIHTDGDRGRLEQALGNLVDNALRHSARRVWLTARTRDSWIELHVIDDGPGFEPQLIERAFERFVRGSSATSASAGAGLGLAIVAAIAAAHGGRACAANRSGGGADVWLELPRSDVPRGATDTVSAAQT
jgi:signal transduction histidine kinase